MEELTLLDYVAILKRRRKYFLITATVLFVLALGFSLQWSNYRSMATVEIDQPEIPAGIAVPIGMSQNDMMQAIADQRISQIQQKVTATAPLIEIITKFDLYAGARKSTPVADIAERMRNKIKVGLVSSALANPAAANKASSEELSAIAFTVSFDYSSPLLAQQVTEELVARFMDEDLKMRREQAQETSAFLGAQITALEATLADQEKKIAEFHAQHGNSRPESLMFNQSAVQQTTLNIQSIDTQMTANEGTQGSLRAQIATVDPYTRVIADGQVLTTPAIQLKALEAQYATLTAHYGPDHPDVVKARHQIDSLKEQIASKKGGETTETSSDQAQLKAQITDVKTNLEAAQKTYGPDNPDVIALKHQLEKLAAQAAAQGKGSPTASTIKSDADNPAYLQFVEQLKSAEEQHKALMEQRMALLEQQKKYQLALTETPASEQEMGTLTRDYENAQLRYRELKEKKMAADMSEQMVQERKGQRLVVIDPPSLPGKTQPSRILLILGGFILSLMGGTAGVIVAEAIGQSIHGARHLSSLVGIAPLVTIPYIYTADERRHYARLRYKVFVCCFLVVAVGAAVFNEMVMPFDVLWSVFAQRLGMS